MSRSSILATKSKWSRRACCSQMHVVEQQTRWQLSGVSRWWASPGAQTITRRSLPASDQTPRRDSVAFTGRPGFRWPSARRATTDVIATTATTTNSALVKVRQAAFLARAQM